MGTMMMCIESLSSASSTTTLMYRSKAMSFSCFCAACILLCQSIDYQRLSLGDGARYECIVIAFRSTPLGLLQIRRDMAPLLHLGASATGQAMMSSINSSLAHASRLGCLLVSTRFCLCARERAS